MGIIPNNLIQLRNDEQKRFVLAVGGGAFQLRGAFSLTFDWSQRSL
jgi:hypothetical protein